MLVSAIQFAVRIITRMLLILLTHWRVKGKENIPSQGALLIVANHINWADPFLLSPSSSRKLIFMAKEELFRSRFSRYLMRRLGAFPVRRGRVDKKALRQAGQVLAEGQVLVMFPEGTRSNDAHLQPAFHGSALIASRNGAPILPVGISGTERIKGVTWLWHRPQITVNIGCPFYPLMVNGKLTKVELAELSNSIMNHIAELLPPEYGGDYARQETRWH